MKSAAAVLGASLLFFLGVLTGVGRRESIPPPTAIPLGVSQPDTPAVTATTGRATRTPSPTTSRSPTTTATTLPTTSSTVATTSTSTTTGPVEQVDNQVDCTPAEKRGKGKGEPCPSTSTSTGDTSGGGSGR